MIGLALCPLATLALGPITGACSDDGRDLLLTAEQLTLRLSPTDIIIEEREPSTETAAAEASEKIPGDTAIGQDDKGEPIRLTLGAQWVVRAQDTDRVVAFPSTIRHPEQMEIAGISNTVVWLVGPGLVGWLRLSDLSVTAKRLGSWRTVPQVLAAGDTLQLVTGNTIWSCQPDPGCIRSGSLPFTVDAVWPTADGWLYAGRGRAPGLYRAVAGHPDRAALLISGTVDALCGAETEPAWTMIRRGKDVRVVAVAVSTPAVRPFALEELVPLAFLSQSNPSADVATLVLERALRDQWSRLDEMVWHAVLDPRQGVRQAGATALGQLPGGAAMAGLWLLAHDEVLAVRQRALDALADRCTRFTNLPCAAALRLFFDDPSEDLSWTARDIVLAYDPATAVTGAAVAFKLDAISTLITRLHGPHAEPTLRTLELLASDPHPAVREAARMALVEQDR